MGHGAYGTARQNEAAGQTGGWIRTCATGLVGRGLCTPAGQRGRHIGRGGRIPPGEQRRGRGPDGKRATWRCRAAR